MKIYVLFLLTKHDENAEAIAVADEYTMDVNPEYMIREEEKVKNRSNYNSHTVVEIEIPSQPIYDRLAPEPIEISGKIVDENYETNRNK